jgi:hypothetical protein
MDPRELMMPIYRLTGKNRKVTSIDSVLCIGVLDITADSLKKCAIKFGANDRVYIDKNRCSKCYLCKLKSKYVHLDSEHYPYISNVEDTSQYDITPEDQIHFESNLSNYDEQSGISKWIYCLFRIYGIEETYTECAISKEYVPQEILRKLGKYRSDAVYGKSVVVDIESRAREFIFVFENKKANTQTDDWIIEAFKQIIAYASSSIYYRESSKELYFIFCYNGSLEIKTRALHVTEQEGLLHMLREIFRDKQNYHLAVLNSAKIYDVVKMTLKTNKKDKKQLIDLILNNEVGLSRNE